MEVKLGKPEVEGVTAAGERLIGAGGELWTSERDEIAVVAEPKPWPDSDWLELWKGADFPMDIEEPTFERGKLSFVVANDDVDRAWEAIKTRVDAVNRKYAEEVIPKREAAEDARRGVEEAHERQLEDARKRIAQLE